MENEPRRPRFEQAWEKYGEDVLQGLAAGEQRVYDITQDIRDNNPDSTINSASAYKCVLFFHKFGLAENRSEVVEIEGKPQHRFYWRLTDKGATIALQKGLIDEDQMLRIVHEREQNPYEQI